MYNLYNLGLEVTQLPWYPIHQSTYKPAQNTGEEIEHISLWRNVKEFDTMLLKSSQCANNGVFKSRLCSLIPAVRNKTSHTKKRKYGVCRYLTLQSTESVHNYRSEMWISVFLKCTEVG